MRVRGIGDSAAADAVGEESWEQLLVHESMRARCPVGFAVTTDIAGG